jgi:hypothetical protein
VSKTLFATVSAFTVAEQAASAYETMPTANPAIVTQIKAYDLQAYNAIQPLMAAEQAGTSAVTAAEVEAAEAAVTTLSTYLQGVK